MKKTLAEATVRRFARARVLPAMLVALHSVTAVAQGGGAGAAAGAVMIRRQDTTVVARVKIDSVRVAGTLEITNQLMRQIDSLMNVQDNLPIASEKYRRVEAELMRAVNLAAERLSPARPTAFGTTSGTMIVMGDPASSASAASAVMAARPPAVIAARSSLPDVSPKGWVGMEPYGLSIGWTTLDGEFIRYVEYPIVLNVTANSPAAKVGVRFGDSVVAFNGKDVRKNTINKTELLQPGRPVNVTFHRDGATREITIVAEEKPAPVHRDFAVMVTGPDQRRAVEQRMNGAAPTPAKATSPQGGQVSRVVPTAQGGLGVGAAPSAMYKPSALNGATMVDLGPDAIKAMFQGKTDHGVLVSVVDPGTSERLGLKGGDLIITVADVDITSVRQFYREVLARASNKSLTVVVLRVGGKTEKLEW